MSKSRRHRSKKHKPQISEALVFGGVGAVAGAGLSLVVGGMGLAVAGTAIGIGMAPVAAAGAVVGLAALGVKKSMKR
jgi:hypothetical protein